MAHKGGSLMRKGRVHVPRAPPKPAASAAEQLGKVLRVGALRQAAAATQAAEQQARIEELELALGMSEQQLAACRHSAVQLSDELLELAADASAGRSEVARLQWEADNGRHMGVQLRAALAREAEKTAALQAKQQALASANAELEALLAAVLAKLATVNDDNAALQLQLQLQDAEVSGASRVLKRAAAKFASLGRRPSARDTRAVVDSSDAPASPSGLQAVLAKAEAWGASLVSNRRSSSLSGAAAGAAAGSGGSSDSGSDGGASHTGSRSLAKAASSLLRSWGSLGRSMRRRGSSGSS